MFVPGMQRLIIRCLGDMRLPWRCFGIESPIIKNVRFVEDFDVSFGIQGLGVAGDTRGAFVDGTGIGCGIRDGFVDFVGGTGIGRGIRDGFVDFWGRGI